MSDRISQASIRPVILIAEDVPRNMEVVCSILRKEGYRLAMAGNGRKALDMAPVVKPDLILLDIMMPELNGYEVCRKLKENPQLSEIPIIFLSARADTEDIVQGFDYGAVDYVTKPFKSKELLARVRSHLELKFARESLKSLNATKDKIYSIIAHDLRDPLQILMLSSEMLDTHYDAMTEEKRRDYIRRFHNNARYLSALLENLLFWSRAQSGSLEISPSALDLFRLVADSLLPLKENAANKQIELISRVPPGIRVFADKNMVLTVLRNLISNAVKFTGRGGAVVVDALRPSAEHLVQLRVIDNGVGMTPEVLEGLFRLESLHVSSGTANERGTGLGLALCKEFVEKNNGKLEVVSTPGSGSTFTVTLPEAPEPES